MNIFNTHNIHVNGQKKVLLNSVLKNNLRKKVCCFIHWTERKTFWKSTTSARKNVIKNIKLAKSMGIKVNMRLERIFRINVFLPSMILGTYVCLLCIWMPIQSNISTCPIIRICLIQHIYLPCYSNMSNPTYLLALLFECQFNRTYLVAWLFECQFNRTYLVARLFEYV